MRTAMLTAMLPFAMEAAFRPAAAAILAKGDALRPLYRSVSRSVLMLCLPASIALILFPERVMAVVGSQFIEAAPVARLIALGTLVYFILGPSGQTLTMAARPRVPFINGLIAGAAGLALNIILIPRVGLIGAGIALCSSWAVSNVMNALAMKRILGVSGVGPRHAPLLLAAIAAAVVALIADSIAPADKYIALAVIGAAMVATYAATLLLMGIAEEDKQFLRSVLLIRSK
jgi:O-antigen/teichoic acid export membrane protein